MHSSHQIRFAAPAAAWTEALPLGNGHLAAMCFGTDRFALNHDTIWSGNPHSERAAGVIDREQADGALREAHSALASGDRLGADVAVRRLQGRYSQAYLPLGDVWLRRADSPELIRRELDLTRALHVSEFADGSTQRAYISAPDGVMVVESSFPATATVTVDFEHQLHELGRRIEGDVLEIRLRAPSDVAPTHEAVDPPITWDDEAVEAAVRIAVVSDGTVRAADGALEIAGATRLRVLLACETTYRGPLAELGEFTDAAARAAERVNAARAIDPAELRERHIADHAALYDRFELSLPGVLDVVPLLVHYGRYLLIASSRPGSLPATLQGIWNEEMRPPWSSNYTLNINTEMNYWGAEVTGLPECNEPLTEFIEALAERGQETAARLYGTRGWVAHHNADAWAFTSPVGQGVADPAWAFWPMAGPWLVRHVVDPVRFATGEHRVELAQRAWPVLTGVLAFLRHWVEEIEPGVWGTPLSTSPENTFVTGISPTHAAVARHSAMDAELIHDAATSALEVADILDLPGPELAEARWLLAHVALPHIGPDGGIAEWYDGETPVDPHHRHVSMLYGAYPGSRDLSEAELGAVGRSLDLRGDDSTGWSLVWKMALRARLRQGAKVSDLLALMFRDATRNTAAHACGLYPNLFAAHPPFQIDGNLGFVGAVSESLIQSHRVEDGYKVIELLPALPPEWRDGSVRGLRLRGGLTADLAWVGGRVDSLELHSKRSDDVTVIVLEDGSGTLVTVPGGGRIVVGEES